MAGFFSKKQYATIADKEFGYKVIEWTMSGVFYLRNVLQFVIDCFEQGSFSEQNLVGNTHQWILHIVFNSSDKLYAIKKKVLKQSLTNIFFVCA